MSSWAKVGAKCVCIKRGGWVALKGAKSLDHPKYGEECIVDAVKASEFGLAVTLVGYADWHLAVRFRPAVDQDDDVALFAHHLDTAPVKPVDA